MSAGSALLTQRRLGRCAAALALTAIATSVDGRTWTNDQGRRLEADFVRLRGSTAILSTGDETIRAPVARLSEEDQAWIAQYRDLTQRREWGTGSQRGRFQVLRDDGVQVKEGNQLLDIPFTDFAPDDWTQVEAIYAHLERELPETFAAARPYVAPPETPPEDAPEREWVDTRGRKIVAVYGGTDGASAVLWREDKRFAFPIDQLSGEDRAWLAQQGVGQLATDLSNGWAAAGELFAAAAKSQRGRRPPNLNALLAAPPTPPRPPRAAATPFEPARPNGAPAVAPTPDQLEQPDATAPEAPAAALQPGAPTARISHIDELSDEEYDAKLAAAYAGYPEIDYDAVPGEFVCSHCEAEDSMPVGYGAGDPCPFCGITLTKAAVTVYEADAASYGRPWYMRRGIRWILIVLVISAISGAVKFMTGGGDEDGGDDD